MEQSVSKEDIAQEFYLDFAEQVLARLGVWVEANPDEIPYNQAFVPDFGDRGHGLVASLEVPDYRSLLDRWWGEEAEWFWTEAEKGVELEIIGGNLSIPETIRDGEDGPMRIATAEEIEAIKEQIKPFLINNIYTQPILSLLYRENKLNFTREELDTEYLIFRGNWRGTDHEWTVTIPLLNLESTYYSADEISIPVSRSLAMWTAPLK